MWAKSYHQLQVEFSCEDNIIKKHRIRNQARKFSCFKKEDFITKKEAEMIEKRKQEKIKKPRKIWTKYSYDDFVKKHQEHLNCKNRTDHPCRALRYFYKNKAKKYYPEQYKDSDFPGFCENKNGYEELKKMFQECDNNVNRNSIRRRAMKYNPEQFDIKDFPYLNFTYEKYVEVFNDKNSNGQLRGSVKMRAKKRFPELYKDSDFPSGYENMRKYKTYSYIVDVYNQNKGWETRCRLKKIAKQRFENEFKDSDFIKLPTNKKEN